MKKEIEFIKWIIGKIPSVKAILIKKYCIESIQMIITLLITLLLGLIIEEIFYKKVLLLLGIEVGLYLALYFIYILLERKNLQEQKRLEKELHVKLRQLLYSKEIRAKAEILKNIETGENLQLFTQDIENITTLFENSLVSIITSFIGIIGVFTISSLYNFPLAIIILVFAIMIVCMTNYSKNSYQDARKDFRKNTSEYLNWTNEHLRGMRDIHMNQSEKMVGEIFGKYTKDNLLRKERIRFIEIKAERVISFISTVFMVMFWATSAFMILNDALTVGLFYVFNKYFNNMIDCISNIFQERLNIRNFLPGFEKIKGHYELESEQEEKILYSIRNRKHSYLSFKDVSFSYANYSVLKDLNIKFESGKMNVIVGENGVGKTTLMDLILRFYNAQKGRIEYGGMDITQYDLKNWRKQIGYVLQDTMIFEGSLKDNILLYAPEASEQHIWNALKIAGLYDTVLQWELKLDTDLLMGERLSHGQRQRVAIARIAAKDSEIILMDEPTANLDYETEQTIISDIKKICNEKILIVITHRENIVRNADRIFVLKDGNVLATGQHEELLETCNYYKNLFDL